MALEYGQKKKWGPESKIKLAGGLRRKKLICFKAEKDRQKSTAKKTQNSGSKTKAKEPVTLLFTERSPGLSQCPSPAEHHISSVSPRAWFPEQISGRKISWRKMKEDMASFCHITVLKCMLKNLGQEYSWLLSWAWMQLGLKNQCSYSLARAPRSASCSAQPNFPIFQN